MADSIRVSLPPSGDEHEHEHELDMEPPDEATSTTSGPGDTSQQRPQKRRRIPVACGACRSKKSRVSHLVVLLLGDPLSSPEAEDCCFADR